MNKEIQGAIIYSSSSIIEGLISIELAKEGEPLLGRIVKIPYKRKAADGIETGFIYARIVSFEVINKVADNVTSSRLEEFSKRIEMVKDSVLVKVSMSVITAISTQKQRMQLDACIVPGESIYFVDEEEIANILKDVFLPIIGTYWGTNIKTPLYLRDFKTLNEAYHFLVAGQTGSGKSTLAKMLISLYAKVSKRLNFLIIDPVGEFSKSFKGKDDFNLKQVWDSIDRRVSIYSAENIALDSWSTLKEMLIKYKVFEPLSIRRQENIEIAAEYIIQLLRDEYRLEDLYDQLNAIMITFDIQIKEIAERTFVSKSGGKMERAEQMVESYVKNREEFSKKLEKVFSLFSTNNRKTIYQIVSKFINSINSNEPSGETVVLDLSGDEYTQDIKKIIVREICQYLYSIANQKYKEGDNFNTLVIFDEAHNYAPKAQGIRDYETEQTTEIIVKSYIETRKFGLGWMVISTRISNLHPKLYEHSRVKFLGYNLHTGQDGDLLRETFGSEIVNIYKMFPDPNDPLSKRKEIVFMIDGPINILSKGTPDFVKIYNIEDFKEVNNLKGRLKAEKAEDLDYF